jgi:methyl-accepting chemotaxis protein
MNWFKNLNATPRLMGSFGVVLVLTLGIGYLAIASLSKSNGRLTIMFEDDMAGSRQANQIASDRLSLGRGVRDAILNVSHPDVVANDRSQMFESFRSIHTSLDDMGKTFYSKEGKEALADMVGELPEYEKGYHDLYDRIEAKDVAGSVALLAKVTENGKVFETASARAIDVKVRRGQEKYVAGGEEYVSSRNLMLGACAISLLAGLILSIVIARSFAQPLAQAVAVLEKVADGDLSVTLDIDSRDEIGQMANALNRAVRKLNSTMQEVAESAANASSSAQQLASAAEAISSGAQEQAASLEETSASLEEITAAVRQSADNANQASQLATSSKDSAESGQQVVAKAITAMSEINAASAKIADIISTIDEIAFQTNLLAVNAAVEAARAGDEGRGFAVVASEVRSLAQRSATAAKEIKVLINDSLKKVGTGSDLVNRSGETLHGIVGSVKRVTDIVGEIAAASGEQSTGIEQVNTAMTQMDQVTQSNSAQTEELSATARSLSEQAEHLLELVSAFTLGDGGTGPRDRQSFQPRVSSPAEPVVASLVHAAKSNMTHSGSNSSPAAKRSTKAPRGGGSANSEGRPRVSKVVARQPALVTAPIGAGNDASFEEF